MLGIEYIRNLNKLSLTEFGKKIRVSNQMVSMWERGIKQISNKRLNQMSEVFSIPVEYFQKKIDNIDMLIIQFHIIQNYANKLGYDVILIKKV